MFLNFAGLICMITNICCSRFPKVVFMLSTSIGLALTYVYITPFNQKFILIKFFNDVILDNMALFGYMAMTMTMGLFILNSMSD